MCIIRRLHKKFYYLLPVIALMAFVVCMSGYMRQKESAPQKELKAKVRRIVYEVWNKGNTDVIDELYSTEVVLQSTSSKYINGLEANIRRLENRRILYPDIEFTINEMIVKGNTVMLLWACKGTQTGQLPTSSVKPTYKHFRLTGCCFFHFEEEKVVEEWEIYDRLTLMQQLGYKLVPPKQNDNN
jgi:predicted ester cyclase